MPNTSGNTPRTLREILLDIRERNTERMDGTHTPHMTLDFNDACVALNLLPTCEHNWRQESIGTLAWTCSWCGARMTRDCL